MEDTYSIAHDRPRRTIRKPAHYAIDNGSGLIAYALIVAQETLEGIKPSTCSEAISCPNLSNWLMEMQEELESLYKNGTWELCELLKSHRTLTAKWIYKRKEGIPQVEDTRWKARLLVCGCNKKKVFNELFSPVVHHTSIRGLHAFVALFDLELEQLYVKTTFLHGEL